MCDRVSELSKVVVLGGFAMVATAFDILNYVRRLKQAGVPEAQAEVQVEIMAELLTINMEIGLISPPVGLNLYVINGIAPDIKLKTILMGSLPFVACMVIAILILCVFPGIATWLPDAVMGPSF